VQDVNQRAVQAAQNVFRKIEDLGFAYDSATGELNYTVQLKKYYNFSSPIDFGLDAGGLAGISFDGQADVHAGVDINFKLGIDFDDIDLSNIPGSLADAIFITEPTIKASVDLSLKNANATGRLGFMAIDVVNGNITASPSIQLTLRDPGANKSDGRIDLSELDNVVSDIGSLVSVSTSG